MTKIIDGCRRTTLQAAAYGGPGPREPGALGGTITRYEQRILDVKHIYRTGYPYMIS